MLKIIKEISNKLKEYWVVDSQAQLLSSSIDSSKFNLRKEYQMFKKKLIYDVLLEKLSDNKYEIKVNEISDLQKPPQEIQERPDVEEKDQSKPDPTKPTTKKKPTSLE